MYVGNENDYVCEYIVVSLGACCTYHTYIEHLFESSGDSNGGYLSWNEYEGALQVFMLYSRACISGC